MTGAPIATGAGTGYELLRVYAVEQSYRLRADSTQGSGSRNFRIGWDWTVAGPRTFDVALTLAANPSTEQPDEASVTIAGTFRAQEVTPTVAFEEFIRFNASATLLP